MVKDRRDRAVTSDDTAAGYGEEIDPPFDLGGDLLATEYAHPGGGEFKRQRQTGDQMADPLDSGPILGIRLEAGVCAASHFDKKQHGAAALIRPLAGQRQAL